MTNGITGKREGGTIAVEVATGTATDAPGAAGTQAPAAPPPQSAQDNAPAGQFERVAGTGAPQAQDPLAPGVNRTPAQNPLWARLNTDAPIAQRQLLKQLSDQADIPGVQDTVGAWTSNDIWDAAPA